MLRTSAPWTISYATCGELSSAGFTREVDTVRASGRVTTGRAAGGASSSPAAEATKHGGPAWRIPTCARRACDVTHNVSVNYLTTPAFKPSATSQNCTSITPGLQRAKWARLVRTCHSGPIALGCHALHLDRLSAAQPSFRMQRDPRAARPGDDKPLLDPQKARTGASGATAALSFAIVGRNNRVAVSQPGAGVPVGFGGVLEEMRSQKFLFLFYGALQNITPLN